MSKFLFADRDHHNDTMRWLLVLKEKNISFEPKHLKDQIYIDKIEAFQNEIIKTKDISFAYFFSCEFFHKVYLMQKVILESKNPQYAFLFAQNVKGSDTQALQKIVIESNKIKYICKFGCFIANADRKLIEKIISNSKNAKYAHMFLKHVKHANVDLLKQPIFKAKKPRYLFELAKHISDKKDLAIIEDMIIEQQSFLYMRLLASKVKNIDIEKLENAIIESGNMEELKKFAKCVRKSKMRGFLLIA
jgi:hypothetical protein